MTLVPNVAINNDVYLANNLYDGCDLTKANCKEQFCGRPGSPFGLEDKGPWNSCMFNCGGFTHKQETSGLDTIQATSLLSRKLLRQREIVNKSWNQENSWELTGLTWRSYMYYMTFVPNVVINKYPWNLQVSLERISLESLWPCVRSGHPFILQ